jgi:DNA-binding response OmpR family regulator
MKRVLVIEDNRDLAAGLESNLELEGYQVRCCDNGGSALEEISRFEPELIVLDMMLPVKDGFEILAEIRKGGDETPVLCLTARGEEVDKVRALRSGADDYVTKPFGLMELLARVEALLRRSSIPEGSTALSFGEVTVSLDSREVRRAGEEVILAPKEFELLAALLARPNVVISRQQLMKTAWGHSSAIASRTVDTHIAELRRKLEVDPARPKFILTARKAGYRLVL